jgi:DNA-directed RNA polymerase specialized sigma24 family protein
MILPKRRARPEVLFGPQPDDRSETISFEVKDSAPNPEEAYDVHERQLKALRAICLLDPPLRAPIRMQVMHGWSVSEISRALNISKAAAKSRLYRRVNGFPRRTLVESVLELKPALTLSKSRE